MPASVRSAASSLSPRMDLTGNLHSTLTAPTASLMGSCPFASNGTPSSPRSHCRTRVPFPRPAEATAHSDRPAKDRSLSHLLGVRGRAVSGSGPTLGGVATPARRSPAMKLSPNARRRTVIAGLLAGGLVLTTGAGPAPSLLAAASPSDDPATTSTSTTATTGTTATAVANARAGTGSRTVNAAGAGTVTFTQSGGRPSLG